MNIWKEYSLEYIKNNRASVISVLAAAFIASLLLSLTCGIFYNIRADEIMLIHLEEGDWQGRLTGNLTSEDIKQIENHPNVRKVVLSEDPAKQEITASLYFYHPRRIYKDLPEIAKQLSVKTGAASFTVTYHDRLLFQDFIFSPEKGTKPPLTLFVYLFILLAACLSLILIIHNAFGVSMNARLHQLGILKSIGASPKQLRTFLIREALLLCLIPILTGVGSGALLCRLFMRFMYHAAQSVRKHELLFHYHPLVFLGAVLVSLLTVWISALIPAIKISRLEPLYAIRYGSEQPASKVRRFFPLSKLFGIEGELARRSLYHRRKAFRTSTLSLTISFLAFSSFLNLETISGISTRYTFFERYKNSWDLMITIPDRITGRDRLLTDIRSLPGVKTCTAYQKASAKTYVTEDMLSQELKSLSGLPGLKNTGITKEDNGYLIHVPLLQLDKKSFEQYCLKIRTDPGQFTGRDSQGAIAVNTIWDNLNSNRRNRTMIPFLNLKNVQSLSLLKELQQNKADMAKIKEIPDSPGSVMVNVAAETGGLPELREEFPDFSLVLIMPETVSEELAGYFTDTESYFTIKAVSAEMLLSIRTGLENLLGNSYDYTLEDRTELERTNTSIRNAYKVVIGSLAGLLICIGLANIFSNTYGHIYQRKREFARYISVGLSPKGVIKVLTAEALLLSLKPVLTGLLLNIPLVYFALKASLIPPADFFRQIPALPVALSALMILIGVGFVYYTAGRKFYKDDLSEILKNDIML